MVRTRFFSLPSLSPPPPPPPRRFLLLTPPRSAARPMPVLPGRARCGSSSRRSSASTSAGSSSGETSLAASSASRRPPRGTAPELCLWPRALVGIYALCVFRTSRFRPTNPTSSRTKRRPDMDLDKKVKVYSSRRQESHLQRRRVTGAGAGAARGMFFDPMMTNINKHDCFQITSSLFAPSGEASTSAAHKCVSYSCRLRHLRHGDPPEGGGEKKIKVGFVSTKLGSAR